MTSKRGGGGFLRIISAGEFSSHTQPASWVREREGFSAKRGQVMMIYDTPTGVFFVSWGKNLTGGVREKRGKGKGV